MGSQNIATLRPLVILGYALGVIDFVLACYAGARVLLGRHTFARTFRKWGKRSQRRFYRVMWMVILPSIVLCAIGQYVPSALLTDIGAIGILTVVLIMEIVELL